MEKILIALKALLLKIQKNSSESAPARPVGTEGESNESLSSYLSTSRLYC